MKQINSAWLAVVNPHAGAGKTLAEWKKAETLLKDRGVDYIYRATDCKFHATELAFNAANEGVRKFIAVGGDGTVHEVLDGIMHSIADSALKGIAVQLSEFFLAVIPIGSGNDWIKSHNVQHSTEEAVELIASGSFARQDVVRVSILQSADDEVPLRTSYMINVGGIGFDARICGRVNAQKDAGKSGRMLYINSLVYYLLRYGHSDVKVLCDGEPVFEGSVYSIALGIGRYSGGGMRQTPDALTDDGLLDITIIPDLPLLRIVREAYRLFNGSLLEVPEIVSRKARSIAVVPMDNAPEPVEVDGEVVGKTPVRFDVLPEQINVLQGR
ncbi:MAG: diacylglycerol kinase family lipid kinase [Bacteroidales bacterium]|nr:diacylglycerol kinase family lipid kinase [Bacteroidales bacterium]